MDETKLVLKLKNVRKAAFAVGVGFTVGKKVGELINAMIDGVGLGVLAILAKRGNEIAQEVCERNNIEYEKKEDCEENSD